MNIKYKIVEVWPNDLVFVVRYYTDLITEEMLAVDDNRKPDGTPVRCRTDISLDIPSLDDEEEKQAFLKDLKIRGPVEFLKRQEKILKNENDFAEGIELVTSFLDIEQHTTEDEIDTIREELIAPKNDEEDDMLNKISEILAQEPKQQ
jgi:hypothetical protein